MDKYEETAKRILEDDNCIHIEGAECFTLDAIKVAAILREAFPAQEPSKTPQAEASEALARIVFNSDGEEIGREMAELILGRLRSDFLGTRAQLATPTAEKALREALEETAEALELALARLGVCGPGDDKGHKADADSWGGTEVLRKARSALAAPDSKK